MQRETNEGPIDAKNAKSQPPPFCHCLLSRAGRIFAPRKKFINRMHTYSLRTLPGGTHMLHILNSKPHVLLDLSQSQLHPEKHQQNTIARLISMTFIIDIVLASYRKPMTIRAK